jgi:hypothetical protein
MRLKSNRLLKGRSDQQWERGMHMYLKHADFGSDMTVFMHCTSATSSDVRERLGYRILHSHVAS